MEQKMPELVASMTLEEKTSLLSGADFWHLKSVERLGIPAIMMADGPHGLRKQAEGADHAGLNSSVPATCFPTASATASSWDRALLAEMGKALGEECLQEGVSVILGPGVNMKRSPLCGRNFEYFSEDPFLAGEMAVAWIDGVQSMGVGTSLKHFAVNNQETRRMTIEAVVDERSLREIYLPAFEAAVRRAKPWTVMCSYNKLNGWFCSEHQWLLTELLREEWGFEGVLVTDWGACNNRFFGLVSGQDLEMPASGGRNDRDCFVELLRNPRKTAYLDRSVKRILNLVGTSVEQARPGYRYDADAHHSLARKVARESMVLLKNDGILPLAKGAKVALIGDFADKPRYQGAGSSLINPTRLDSARSEIGAYTDSVVFAKGYEQAKDLPDEALIAEAVEAARGAEFALVYVGLTATYETEGADRAHIRLPASHDRLVEAVAAANPNTIVVLHNGSAVAMPWLGSVRAVLEAFLSGQAGAGAALDLLFGAASPSGKLAESYPVALEDLASTKWFPEGPKTVEYREGPYIGYRWFDASGTKPLFPFGFGLSYTSFEYSDLAVPEGRFTPGRPFEVKVTIRNNGRMAGAEVVQLYVRDPESTLHRPVKELKGFHKVFLEPGASTTVAFSLDDRSFAYWAPSLGAWHVEAGDFEILVGASSKDIRLRATIRAEGSTPNLDIDGAGLPASRKAELPSYHSVNPSFNPGDAEFEALYGKRLPKAADESGLAFTKNSTIGDIGVSPLGRLVGKAILKGAMGKLQLGDDAGTAKMVESMMADMPLRNLPVFSDGMLPKVFVTLLLALLNAGKKPNPEWP